MSIYREICPDGKRCLDGCHVGERCFGMRNVAPTDTERLDWLREETCDLRCIDIPTGQGDGDVHWQVIQHHMAEPHERVIGRCYSSEPRDAIDLAMKRRHRPNCDDPMCPPAATVLADTATANFEPTTWRRIAMNWICLVRNPSSGAIVPIVDDQECAMQWGNLAEAKATLADHPLIRAWEYWLINLDEVEYETI